MEGFEKNKTPEEIAEIEKSRTISDAQMLQDGARYVVDAEGNKRLDPTLEQINKAKGMMNAENAPKETEIKSKTPEGITSDQALRWEDVQSLQSALSEAFGNYDLGDFAKDVARFKRVNEVSKLIPVYSEAVKLIGQIDKSYDSTSIKTALKKIEGYLLAENIEVVTPKVGRKLSLDEITKYFQTEISSEYNKNYSDDAVVSVIRPAFINHTTKEVHHKGLLRINQRGQLMGQ